MDLWMTTEPSKNHCIMRLATIAAEVLEEYTVVLVRVNFVVLLWLLAHEFRTVSSRCQPCGSFEKGCYADEAILPHRLLSKTRRICQNHYLLVKISPTNSLPLSRIF